MTSTQQNRDHFSYGLTVLEQSLRDHERLVDDCTRQFAEAEAAANRAAGERDRLRQKLRTLAREGAQLEATIEALRNYPIDLEGPHS